jgi:hypothetical protein
MGIGYAWWTDSVVIGGTATTGNMDVHFENIDPFPKFWQNKYVEPSIIVAEDRKITCKFDNLYPDAIGTVQTMVKNDSSIPVKLDQASIVVNADEELAPYLNGTAHFYKTDVNGKIVSAPAESVTGEVALEQLANALNQSSLKDYVLEPGEGVQFIIVAGIDKSAEKETTQKNSFSYTLTLDWKQFNQD